MIGLYGCTKQDLNTNLVSIKENNRSKFFNNNGRLSPNVEKVLNNAKVQMTDKQIDDFITKAGMIYWDNAKSYSISVIANTSNATSSGDSIVILPVALPNDNNINAVLVARLLANGYDITYSIHYKSEYKSIDSTFLPAFNITAKELYLLGMAQLDFEVFGHKFFLLNDKSVTFGQPITGTGEQLKYIGVNQGPSCLYTFTYYPFVGSIPIPFWAYSVPGDCSITNISLPPAIFLEGLDDTYGNGSGSSSAPLPEGGGGPASPYSLQFSVFYQSLSASQKTFLEDAANNEYYNGFINYLVLHQFSQEATDHIIWCINYLLSPTTLVQNYAAFAAVYLNDFPSLSFLSQDEINWLNNYPYLKSRVYYFLQHSSTILNAEQKVQFHINKMRTESSYLLFNTNYSQHPEFLNLWFNDVNYLYDFGGVAFGEWAINYILMYPLEPFAPFQEQFMPWPTVPSFDYSNLNNHPIIVNDDIVLMPLGFDFQFQNFDQTTDPPIRQIGKIDPRLNTEDMEWGNNGDISGILSNMPNFNDLQLFDEVEDLFHKTSTGILETVGDLMIDKFRSSTGGIFSNVDLSQKVFESSEFKNFIIKFGIRLNAALLNANWNINNVTEIKMPKEQRPKFNGLYNKINGLQILLNDTEETIIELTGFSINTATHKWTANLNIIIKDHFGLDKNDALTYQNKHAGFAAWWLLQHTRSYKPFETQIRFKMNLVSQ